MIINSKKKFLNCILLRKGGDKLFIHKYIPKQRLPMISSNYQNNIKILVRKPFIKEMQNYSLENNYLLRNTNNISFKAKTILSETIKKEDSSLDLNNCTNNNITIKKKSIGISVSPEDFSSYENTLNRFTSCNNSLEHTKRFTFLNSKNNNDKIINLKYNKGIKIINNNDIKYRNNISLDPNSKTFKLEDLNTNSINSLDSILRRKNFLKKEIEKQEKQNKIKDKKKFDFIKKVLKHNKNFLIDEYLRNKNILKNKKYLSNIDDKRSKFLNNIDENQKQYGTPILVKDIRIKSLLNNYEKKRIKLVKLSPIIIRNNYLKNKFGKDMNKISGIKDYELKINFKKKNKYHINLGNLGNIFDLTKRK